MKFDFVPQEEKKKLVSTLSAKSNYLGQVQIGDPNLWFKNKKFVQILVTHFPNRYDSL